MSQSTFDELESPEDDCQDDCRIDCREDDDRLSSRLLSRKFKRKIITGEAGTSKTTTLMKIVHEFISNKCLVVCLGFTHSSVSTMRSTYLNLFDQIESTLTFKTIHSFFNIDPSKNEFNFKTFGRLKPDWIVIDEFSLIPIDFINSISQCQCHLIFSGDLLQLNPVDNDKSISSTLFSSDNFKNILVNSSLDNLIQVSSHLSNNIFNTEVFKSSDKLVLTKNYRNGTNVMKILNRVLNEKIIEPVLTLDELKRDRMKYKDYVVLSSRYSNLNKVYRYLHPLKLNDTHLQINTRIGLTPTTGQFILTENINRHFYNNDIVEITGIINDDVTKLVIKHSNQMSSQESNQMSSQESNQMSISTEQTESNLSTLTTTISTNQFFQFPLLPVDYCTIHKSQGRTIKNIIIILDDLFEFSMLYTGVTRAISNVEFVKINRDLDLNQIYTLIDQFNLLRSIVNHV